MLRPPALQHLFDVIKPLCILSLQAMIEIIFVRTGDQFCQYSRPIAGQGEFFHKIDLG